MAEEFTEKVLHLIKSIPKGKVLTYGGVAALAGNPRGARQVARILHSMSGKHKLPWYRVINSNGHISLPRHCGYEEQKQLLEREGIGFSLTDRIDLATYMWIPGKRIV